LWGGESSAATAHNYAALSAPSKWPLGFAMLLGRLELFTLLVISAALLAELE